MPILGLAPTTKPVHPAHFDIEKVIRPNILSLLPYRCARDDYSTGILLDANENAFGHSINASASDGVPSELTTVLDMDLHRYPDPSHPAIKSRIAQLRAIPGSPPDHVFLGVGSDEVIDLLIRVCVRPSTTESILITPPTYGMYSVCAQVNDVSVIKVPLILTGEHGEGGERGRFSVDVDAVKSALRDLDAAGKTVKLLFLCSPGNPTGTLIPLSTVRQLCEYEGFKGIVVVDEAYIDFAQGVQVDGKEQSPSAASLISEYANLCVLQTLSKSFGLAAIRLGIALAQPPLIQILSNTKAPYNISTPTAFLASSALSPPSIAAMHEKLKEVVRQRSRILSSLASDTFKNLGVGNVIGGNDANFVVLPILEKPIGSSNAESQPDSTRAHKVYKALAEEQGVVVRYRGNEPGCAGCLRITVGTEEENGVVLGKLEEMLRLL